MSKGCGCPCAKNVSFGREGLETGRKRASFGYWERFFAFFLGNVQIFSRF